MASTPLPLPHRRRAGTRGVTLIELMVGLVIGLLAVLVITQVALLFEGQKRSTTGGADAQVNGALALQVLQREIQAAGYGITTAGAAGCEIRGRNGATVPFWNGTPMVAVRIVDGTDAARGSPDRLVTMRSNKAEGVAPVRLTGNFPRNGTQFTIAASTNIGFAVGDLAVVVPPLPVAGTPFATWCSVFRVSANPVKNPSSAKDDPEFIPADAGAWNDVTTPVYPGLTMTSDAYNGALTGPASHLVNLGSFLARDYGLSASVSATELQLRSSAADGTDTTESLFPQVVNLQAVYGHDTSATRDNVIDAWNATSPTTPDGWARVLAVRVALVARSMQYEKEEVTTAAPTWRPDGVTLEALPIDHVPDWRHYRYKVFEAVVPLRNMIWQS